MRTVLVFIGILCVADMYVKDIETKTTVSDVEPKILRESVATAHVDGMNALGPVVGNFCMKIAIAKAKEAGISLVVAKGRSVYLSIVYCKYILIGKYSTLSSLL